MKFTIDRRALVKMLELIGKKTPTQKRRDKQVRLFAFAARVFVEAKVFPVTDTWLAGAREERPGAGAVT